jgi:hypothetical protein
MVRLTRAIWCWVSVSGTCDTRSIQFTSSTGVNTWGTDLVLDIISVGWAFTVWGTDSVSRAFDTYLFSGTGDTFVRTCVAFLVFFVESGVTVTNWFIDSVGVTCDAHVCCPSFTGGTSVVTFDIWFFFPSDGGNEVVFVQVLEGLVSVGSITERDGEFFHYSIEGGMPCIFSDIQRMEFSVEVFSI